MPDDEPQMLESDLADKYIAKDSPSLDEVRYVYQFAVQYLLSLDADAYQDKSEFKTRIKNAIDYFDTSISLYAGLGDSSREEAEKAEAARISLLEACADEIFHFAKLQKPSEDGIFYLELADDLYARAISHQAAFGEIPLDLLFNRIYTHTRLIGLDKTYKASHEQFIHDYILQHKLLELNAKLSSDQQQANMLFLQDYIDVEETKSQRKRPRVPSTEKLQAPPKALRFLHKAEAEAPESSDYSKIFNTAIDEFLEASKDHLDQALVAEIILMVTDIYQVDDDMQKILLSDSQKSGQLQHFLTELIQSCFESAAALDNEEAVSKLKIYRRTHAQDLKRGNYYRATPEIRKNKDVEAINEYINAENKKIAAEKIEKEGPSNYLKNFLQDQMAEIEVQFKKSKTEALGHLLYLLGHVFLDEEIELPDAVDNSFIGHTFIQAAAKLDHSDAREDINDIYMVDQSLKGP